MEGIFPRDPPTLWKFQIIKYFNTYKASYISLTILAFDTPPPNRENFQYLLVGGRGWIMDIFWDHTLPTLLLGGSVAKLFRALVL